MGFPAPQSHLCDDLLLSRVLILSGIPNLPTGTAVMFLELGWSTPRGQVTVAWSSCPHLVQGCSGAVSADDSWGLYCGCAENEYEGKYSRSFLQPPPPTLLPSMSDLKYPFTH